MTSRFSPILHTLLLYDYMLLKQDISTSLLMVYQDIITLSTSDYFQSNNSKCSKDDLLAQDKLFYSRLNIDSKGLYIDKTGYIWYTSIILNRSTTLKYYVDSLDRVTTKK